MYRCSNSTMNETSCLHQVAWKGISRWGCWGISMYSSWNKWGIWKVFCSVIWPLEQRDKITLIEKANFWLFLVQWILPARESGPGTRVTSMSMCGQVGVCQKTNTWPRGTWSREILFCPKMRLWNRDCLLFLCLCCWLVPFPLASVHWYQLYWYWPLSSG